MSQIPHIAFFEPGEVDKPQVETLLSRHQYALHPVNDPDELLMLVRDSSIKLTAIVVPMRLATKKSVIGICVSTKSVPELTTVPLVTLAHNRESATMQSLYGAGSDVILYPPYDAEAFFYQVCSLHRLGEAIQEKNSSLKSQGSLVSATLKVLDFAHEGILVFSRTFAPLFINASAKRALGILEIEGNGGGPIEDSIGIQSCIECIKQILKTSAGTPAHLVPPQLTTISRVSGERIGVYARCRALLDEQDMVAGYALLFSTAQIIGNLSHIVEMGLMARSLFILETAATLKYLKAYYPEVPLAPLDHVQSLIDSEPPRAFLNSLVLTLLEILDQAVGDEVRLKIDMPEELYVAVRESDLLQIMAHLTLFAVEQAGHNAEVVIAAAFESESGMAAITISADLSPIAPIVAHDHMSILAHGLIPSLATQTDALTVGLSRVNTIAARYATSIQYKITDSKLKLRVIFPRVSPTHA